MKPDKMVEVGTTRDIIELITGGWRAQALYTAVKLMVPDHIETGRRTSWELAQAIGASQDGIQRLMRLLVSINVFEGNDRTGYRNTTLSLLLLDRSHSLRDMCLLYGEECYAAWGHACHSIRTASSGFQTAYGQSFYEYLSQNANTAKRFQQVMNTGSMFFHWVTEIFDFSGNKMVVDVGGGGGQLLATILNVVPDARGTLFDKKHMLSEARKHLGDTIGLERVEFVDGDMFKAVPAGGDIYLLSRVLAGWGDDKVVNVFKNCRLGMADLSSRLLIFDRLVEDEKPTMLPALWDLQLLMTIGGRHRTLGNFEVLLKRGGFKIEHVSNLPMETTAIIAAPINTESS